MVGQSQTFHTVFIVSFVIFLGFISVIAGSRCQLNVCKCTPYRVVCDQSADMTHLRFTGAERMDVKYVVLSWNAKGLLDMACTIFPKLVEVYIKPGLNADDYLDCDRLPNSCHHVQVSCM